MQTCLPHPGAGSKQRARDVLLAALLLLNFIGCTRASSTSEAVPERPNIIFIMADDLGYGDIEPYGQEKIHTPNLAQMAREGMLFTQYYSGATVCAPSRSVLMTGLHMGHTPVRGNADVHNAQGQIMGQTPLPAGVVTLAEMLSGAGYERTGAFGKWGLGVLGSEGLPTRQGFDEFFGYLDQWRAHFYYPEYLIHNGEKVPLEGNETATGNPPLPGAGHPIKKAVYSHDRITEEALEFIEENQDERFFLYVPFTIPHVSLQVPESSLQAYLNEEGESIFPETPFPPGHHYSPQPMPRATYAAMISRMDRDVGRILDKLEELGLTENTIVFFTSDNGPWGGNNVGLEFFDSNGPFRGGKQDLYEGGIRVPMIVRWPGHVPAGAVTDHIAYHGDVMATLADLANTSPPDSIDYLRGALPAEELLADLANLGPADSIDSISFLPTLLGRPERQKEHDYLYWESYVGTAKQAVRMGKWKALRIPMISGDLALYNLREDIGEQNNVADEHPEVIRRIDEIMEKAHTPSPLWHPEAE